MAEEVIDPILAKLNSKVQVVEQDPILAKLNSGNGISLPKEQYESVQKAYSGLDSIFNNLKTTIQDAFKQPEIKDVYSSDNKVQQKESTIKNVLGISIPHIQPESHPIKSLIQTNTLEQGNDSEQFNDSPSSIYRQQKIQEITSNDINYLKDANINEVAEFIQNKKDRLKQSIDKNKDIFKPSEITEYGNLGLTDANEAVDFKQIEYGLNNLAKGFAIEKAPVMSNNIDAWEKATPEEIIKQAKIVGNNVINSDNNTNRVNFEAIADLDEQHGGYSNLYKDNLAYTGIQTEINNTSKLLVDDGQLFSDKLKEIEDLSTQLRQDPTNISLIGQIKQKVAETNPIKSAIDQKKSFITKLSETTFNLKDLKARQDYQNKVDKEFERFSNKGFDAALPTTYVSELGEATQYALQGLSNRILKSAAYADVSLQAALGAKTEDTQKDLSNLQQFQIFTTPTKLKEGKVIDFDNSKINWNIAIPMALQTTGETLAMGAIGSPLAATETIAGKLGGLYLGSTLVFGGDILEGELDKGLNFQDALGVTSIRLAAEAATEIINPLEFIPFNGITKNLVGNKMSKSAFLDFVGNNWKTLFPRLKGMGVDLVKTLTYAGKNAGLESFEEIMSDLSNYGIDEYVVNNIKPDYRRDNDFTFQNEINTALTTALTMIPMAGYAGIKEVQADKYAPNVRWQASQMPDLFNKNLEENFKKGRITEDFYNSGKEEVKKISSLYNANKLKLDVTKDDLKPQYLNALYKQQEINAKILANPNNTESLIKELESISKTVVYFDQEALKNINLTPQDKIKKREDLHIQNLKDFVSPQELKQASLEDLKLAQTTIQEVVNNPFSEKVKQEAQKQLEKVNSEIEEKLKPVEITEEKPSIVETEKQRINTLTLEDLNNESPFENDNLSEEEQSQLADEISNRRNTLENEANTIDLQGTKFVKGDKVSTDGNKTFWFVKGKDENNNLLLERTINGTKETTSISNQPSNKNSVTPYVEQKETTKEQPEIVSTEEGETQGEEKVESSNNLTNIPESQDIPLPIEDKKADIEKRRQEELKLADDKAYEESSSEFKEKYQREGTEFDHPEINAKYDAELAALEQPKEVVTQVTDKKIEETSKEIVKETEVENKAQVVKWENSAKRQNYFGTSVKQNDIQWESVLTDLKEKAEKEGKTYSELGYFITVIPESQFPKEAKTQKDKDWEKQVKEGTAISNGVKVTQADLDTARYAVITDKEGNFKKFDGNVVYSYIPKVSKTEKKGVYSLGVDKSYTNQKELETLYNLRSQGKPVTLEIQSISQGFPKLLPQQKTPLTSVITGSQKPFVTIGNKQYPVQMNKISSELANALILLSRVEIKSPYLEQLPENLRDYASRFRYIQEVFYNKLGGKISLNKDGSITSKGEIIDDKQARKLLLDSPINYTPSILDIPFTYVTFKEGKFETKEYKTGNEFIAENSLYTPTESTVAQYINFGQEVLPKPVETPKTKETKEVSVIIDNPVTQPLKEITAPKRTVKGISKDKKADDLLKRGKSLVQNTTEKQNQEAEEWFNNSPISKHINLKDFRNIVNSDAWATWTSSALTLWKGSNLTDLYHEAWHEFSQLYLTKDQKQALYKELGKEGISNFDAEELIAEDFQKYILSGQKLILGNSPKRNSIFRKIYNFLKELITGNVDIQTYYERLYNGNINKYQRDLNNAEFGKLNKSIDGITEGQTKDVMSALDRAIASEFEDRGLVMTYLFSKKGVLQNTYNVLNNYYANQSNLAQDVYNQKLEEFGKNPTDTKLAELNEIKLTYDNLNFLLDNWESITKFHKDNSKYLQIAKEAIDDSSEDEEDIKLTDLYDSDNTTSSKDQASKRVLYTIASLPKFVGDQAIANPFIPVQLVQEEDGKIKDHINPDVVDFDKTWNLLSKTLQNTYNYNQIYTKIENLAKTRHEFDYLLPKLPNATQQLTEAEMNIKHQFIQDLSKPLNKFYKVILSLDDNGDLVTKTYKSGASATKVIGENFTANFQTSEPTEYIKPNTNSVNELDVEKVVNDFRKGIKSDRHTRLDFLNSIGFKLDEKTLAVSVVQDLLRGKNIEEGKDPIYKIFQSLDEYNKNKTSFTPTITNPVKQLSKGLKTGENVIYSNAKEAIEKILELEVEYNDDYYSDSITNAAGDPIWQIEKWSLQTLVYNHLSDVESYPTYGDLTKSPLGFIFDINTNPDMDNVYINSMFDLSTGNRRTDKQGKPITIEIINQDGLEIQPEKTEREGGKTTNLTPNDKFIQDFNSLLTTGVKEHVRYGDKNSAKGTLITTFKDETGRDTGFLPVPIESFNSSKLPQTAKVDLRRILNSELTRTKDLLTQNLGSNWKNFNKNGKKLGLFDGIIKGELANSILEDLKTLTPKQTIDKHSVKISEAVEKYFEQESKKTKKLLDKIPLDTNQKINSKLLDRNSEETLIKAYTVNNWILNADHVRLMFSDPRFFKNSKDSFKRFSLGSSNGLIAVNDDQTNEALNRLFPNTQYQKAGWTGTETINVNTVIFNEDIRKSKFYDIYKKFWMEVGKKTSQQADELLAPLTEMKIGDGQGWGTLDFIRRLKLKQGSDHWTLEHETLYKKIVNNELLSTEELGRAGMIFPVKIRVAGWTQDKSEKAVPIDYKFAVVPLLPQALKNTPFEEIHNNMLKQGVGIGLFESGSKHSAIMNSPTEFNKFYDNEEKTVAYTGEYVTNSINYDFIFDVLNVEPKLKDEVTFSTQLRRLLFSNFFKDGKPTNPELYNKFNKAIQGLVDIEKENILKKVNAKWNETTKQYDIDEAKFGAYLEEEFDRRNLPDNAKEILKINKEGKFQYPLDASVMRQTIESIAISIIDGKLRKQKGFGEALIQQSSSGFEQNSWKFDSAKEEDILKYGTNGFPFYSPNENKTTAAKIGVSIATGDFKKLLKLNGLDGKPIEILDRLNEAIKDDNWLNQDSHRQMISLTAVRIPVQGHNSMEFMEVYHFLPETAGNVIVVSPELVAKSGGDFDVDKLTTLFNHIYLDENGIPKPYTELSEKQITEKYDTIKNEFLRKKLSPSTKLIADMLGISESQMNSLIAEEVFEEDKLPTKNQFVNFWKKAALQNSLNQTIREVLESPENFRQLMLPNSTDIFEPSSDELKKAKLGEETNYWSDIASAKENYQQFASNLGGKKSLGIGAVYNTFFAGLQSVGAYLNFQYVDGFGKEKPVNIYLEHNTTKDDHVSVSRVFDKSGKHLISESISQLMNGWVDIAKKDWVFYMNGIQEVAPTQLYMLMTGVSPETMQAFTNQPIIDDYLEALQANKSLIVKLSNPIQYKEAKLEALTSAFEKYLPWNENGEFIIEEPVKGGVRKNIYKKSEIRDTTNIQGTDIKNVYLLRSKLSKYGKIDATTFSLDKLKPVSLRKLDAGGLEQIQILTHFLQLQDQAQALSAVNKALNADRSKPAFLHKSALRYNSKASLEESDILPKPILDKLYEETTTAAFNSQKTGIDKFTQELFGGKQLFKLTNHPTFNQFISTEWNKDADLKFSDKFKNEEEWFKTIKNDLISFIYQNYVIKPFTNQLVTDGVVELMSKSKTLDGVNQSLGDQLLTLKKQFPELTKINSLLNLLTIDNSKKRNITSIKLKKDNVDADLSNQLSQDFDKLLNFSDLSAQENQLIQNFAKNLANFAFVQSGLNKSPLSFTQIIPQEHWSEGISPIIDEYTKYLDKGYKEIKNELDKFYKAFKTNNSKFYTAKDELDEENDIIKTVGDRQIAVESYRFKDYRIANVNDQIANKKELNAIQKLAKEKNKVLVTDFNAELPSKQPKILFIGESDKNMSSTAGSGVVNTNKSENVILLPLKNKASNKPGSYFSDENYISNTELISKTIAKIQEQSQKYSKIAFPTEGFLTSINNLMEDAPKTATFLVDQLQEKLHYTDPNFNFSKKAEKLIVNEEKVPILQAKEEIPLKQEVIEQPIQNKEGIDFVFEQSPELAKIGSKEQYSSYISTIFPESKVKDIVYRGDENFNIEDKILNKTGGNKYTNGVYFTKEKREAAGYINDIKKKFTHVFSAILNLQNPRVTDVYDKEITTNALTEAQIQDLKSKNIDGLDIGISGEQGFEYVVFEPEQIHILGGKQDIEGFKKFVEQPINKEIKPDEIYSQLGDKTATGNVIIKPWSDLKNMTNAFNAKGIVSTRIPNTEEHFGNPFSHDPAGKTQGLIKTETIKEAVEKYIDWVINSQDKRAKWIREELKSGELKGEPILYYKELGEPSHATALDYLINKYDWNVEQPIVEETKEKDEKTKYC
jgi:hypothetical protein